MSVIAFAFLVIFLFLVAPAIGYVLFALFCLWGISVFLKAIL